jgi:hypothetical protein
VVAELDLSRDLASVYGARHLRLPEQMGWAWSAAVMHAGRTPDAMRVPVTRCIVDGTS